MDDTNVNKEEKERNIRLEDQELVLHSRDAVRFTNLGGHNLPPPPLVGIGLTEIPNSGWAKAHPAHPLTASPDHRIGAETERSSRK